MLRDLYYTTNRRLRKWLETMETSSRFWISIRSSSFGSVPDRESSRVPGSLVRRNDLLPLFGPSLERLFCVGYGFAKEDANAGSAQGRSE